MNEITSKSTNIQTSSKERKKYKEKKEKVRF